MQITGHCKEFYSIAEHCVRTVDLLISLGNTEEEILKQALLHDAAEAYICDLSRPVKEVLLHYNELEKMILRSILSKFKVAYPLCGKVKEVDDLLLFFEARKLLQSSGQPWINKIKICRSICCSVKIEPWDSEVAEKSFLDTFDSLFTEK